MNFRNYPVKDALGTSDYLLTIDRTNRGISMVAVANLLGIDTSTPAAVSSVPGVCQLPIGFSGFRFALGLGIAITGGAADSDTTAVAAGQVKVILSRTV